MKRFLILLPACFFLILFGGTAVADTVVVPTSSCLVLTGPETGVPGIEAAIKDEVGAFTYLYKKNEDDGKEAGPFAPDYWTSFTEEDPAEPGEFSGAVITWEGPSFIDPSNYGRLYLLVKDGSATPAWYLFDLTCLGWDGKELLTMSGFWPNKGAISHVAIIGTTSVAEPATLSLLGLALCAVGWISRRRD